MFFYFIRKLTNGCLSRNIEIFHTFVILAYLDKTNNIYNSLYDRFSHIA